MLQNILMHDSMYINYYQAVMCYNLTTRLPSHFQVNFIFGIELDGKLDMMHAIKTMCKCCHESMLVGSAIYVYALMNVKCSKLLFTCSCAVNVMPCMATGI